MIPLKAVKPYIYDGLNFKDKAFNAWKETGLATTEGYYPKILRWLLFRNDLFPTLWQGEAHLVFVQPVSLYFDAGLSVLTHEIIPFIWDCWPEYYDKTERWMRRHRVKTAIFTALQEMQDMQKRLPGVRMIHCPEAINTAAYDKGRELTEREIDILEFGRSNKRIIGNIECKHHVCTADLDHRLTDTEFRNMLQNSKVCICFPKSMTHPEDARGIETLTQRYWEAMLSRTVLAGHCPQELIDITGYNPVIELNLKGNITGQLLQTINNISSYQALANKNRATALEHGDWANRWRDLNNTLRNDNFDTKDILSHSF